MNYKSFCLNYILMLGVGSALHDKTISRDKVSSIISIRQGYSNDRQAKITGIDLGLKFKKSYCDSLFFDFRLGISNENASATHFGDLSNSRFVDLGEVTVGIESTKKDLRAFNKGITNIYEDSINAVPGNNLVVPMTDANIKSFYASIWNQLTSYYSIDNTVGGYPAVATSFESFPAFIKRYDAIWPKFLYELQSTSSIIKGADRQTLKDNILHHGTKPLIDIVKSLEIITGNWVGALSLAREIVRTGSKTDDTGQISKLQEFCNTFVTQKGSPAVSSKVSKSTILESVDLSIKLLVDNGLIKFPVNMNADTFKATFKEVSNPVIDAIYQNMNDDGNIDTEKFYEDINKVDYKVISAIDSLAPLVPSALDITNNGNEQMLYAINNDLFRESKFFSAPSGDPDHPGQDITAYNNAKKPYEDLKDSFKPASGSTSGLDNNIVKKIDKLIFYQASKGLFQYIKKNPIVLINADASKTAVSFSQVLDIYINTIGRDFADIIAPSISSVKEGVVTVFGNMLLDVNQPKPDSNDIVSPADRDKYIDDLVQAINEEIPVIEANLVIDLSFARAMGMSMKESSGMSVSGKSCVFTIGKSTCISKSRGYSSGELRGSHIDIGIGGTIMTEKYTPYDIDENIISSLFELSTRDVGLGVICGLDIFTESNDISISPELGLMFGIVAMSRAEGAEFDPGSPADSSTSSAYRSIERQAYKPIITFSLPISIRITNRLFINLEFNKLLVARILKQEYRTQNLKSLLLENRKCDSIGIGISYIS